MMKVTRRSSATGANRSKLVGRAVDVVVGTVLAILTLPMLVLAALGSAIALRAWPFFCQDRVGKDGKLFSCFKIRTLPTSVPRYVDKHQLDLQNIPAFCRFLRAHHLDEFPQIYDVILGHMSLTGPRPEMQHLHDQMDPHFAALRTSIRPGCTGLWQISESHTELIHSAPAYDRHYLANRSLRLDFWMLCYTVAVILRLRPGITLATLPSFARPATNVVDLQPLIARADRSREAGTPLAQSAVSP